MILVALCIVLLIGQCNGESLPESFEPDVVGDTVGSGEVAPPPSPPPAAGTAYSVVSFTASGDVTDYDETKKTSIQQAFADELSVPVDKVVVVISSGSVVITATIEATSVAAATAHTNTLTSVLTSPTATTSFLVNHGVSNDVVVASTPQIQNTVATPPSGPSGLSSGAVASIVVPILLLAVAITTVAYIKCVKEPQTERLMSSMQVEGDVQLGYAGKPPVASSKEAYEEGERAGASAV
jgi:hypothetical protein